MSPQVRAGPEGRRQGTPARGDDRRSDNTVCRVEAHYLDESGHWPLLGGGEISYPCTLAFWHHPRWSSGISAGNSSQVEPFVELLYTAGTDVILSGHEHNYERYAPQAPGAELDPANGITEFVVGTVGHGLSPLGDPDPNNVVGNDSTFGVLETTLHPAGYDFAFRAYSEAT